MKPLSKKTIAVAESALFVTYLPDHGPMSGIAHPEAIEQMFTPAEIKAFTKSGALRLITSADGSYYEFGSPA